MHSRAVLTDADLSTRTSAGANVSSTPLALWDTSMVASLPGQLVAGGNATDMLPFDTCSGVDDRAAVHSAKRDSRGAHFMRIRSRFWRAGVVIGVVGLGALLAPAAAFAAPGGTRHTVTMTEITHGVFDAGIEGPNPCSGADIVSVNASGTVVNHVTFFPAGDEVWATFTETGKVTILDSNGVTYTGHLTAWGNVNMNEQNANNSFTLTIILRGSDGSTITAHEVQHFALNANGVVTVDFDTMRLTCG
jgi:hypothetical protein